MGKKQAGLLLPGFMALALVLSGPGMSQAAENDWAKTAHLTLEQPLEGEFPGQVMVAQQGLVIRSQLIQENGLNLSYPQVYLAENPEASRKISRYLKKVAEKSRKDYEKANVHSEKLTSYIHYRLCHYGEGYLSVREYGMDYFERAAHPLSWERGYTFSLKTGELVKWQDLVPKHQKALFTLEKINEKLWATPYGTGHYFYPEFKGLEKLPENYYLDPDGSIHFLFQPYEIAPYAVGIIDLSMQNGI